LAAKQRHPERAQFSPGEPAADDRILRHDLPRGVFIAGVEDDQAGVDGAERGAGEDQLPLGQQALQPLEVLGSDRLLGGRHGPGEVIGGGRMK
jgi:hypothetical protein